MAVRHFSARYRVTAHDIEETDITDLVSLRATMADVRPAVVLNCAAYTAVDDCESQAELAHTLNGVAPGLIATACRECDALLVQISTDYVFDGSGTVAYLETDETGPVSVYGESKLRGEQAVIAQAGAYLIARTAWLYGSGGKHFVGTIKQLLETRPSLQVVSDQLGCPTSTRELCRQLDALITANCRGIYHTVCDGECSWYEFARAIAELRGAQASIVPCGTEAFPRPARRPANSRLSTDKLQHDTGHQPMGWHEALVAYMEEEGWRRSS